MLAQIAVIAPLALALAGGPVGRPPADTPSGLHADARIAVAPDAQKAQAACDRLRAEGPAGLDALLAEHKQVLDHGSADPMWPRVTQAIDKVAAQKDAYASRLYWYTDIEQAKAAARVAGKPILSVHLAGRLDSKRNALYADPKVSALLRERFVLHWESEPQPDKVTIDLGAGKSVERKVAGTDVHWVLDADGRPVDALPQVARASAFGAELKEDADLERSLRGLTPSARADKLSRHHAIRRAILDEEVPPFMVDNFSDKAAKMLKLA